MEGGSSTETSPVSETRLRRLRLCLHPGDEYVGSLEPESLQVLTYLKLANCSSEVTIEPSCYSSSPVLHHGNGPSIQHTFEIISYLKDMGYNIDSRLTQQQSSEALAYSCLLTDRLLPALLYMQWLDTQNYLGVTRLKYGELLSFPHSLIYLSSRRKSVTNFIMRGVPLECTLEEKQIELLERATECLSLLSAKLGTANYLYGDLPSSLDALLFGYLEVIGQRPLLGSNALHSKLHSCHSLLSFCRRMREDCFPLMKKRASTGIKDAVELTSVWRAPSFWVSVGVVAAVLGIQVIRVGLFSNRASR